MKAKSKKFLLLLFFIFNFLMFLHSARLQGMQQLPQEERLLLLGCPNMDDVLTDASGAGGSYIRKSLHGLRRLHCTMCKGNTRLIELCSLTNDTMCSSCPDAEYVNDDTIYVNEDYHLSCECKTRPTNEIVDPKNVVQTQTGGEQQNSHPQMIGCFDETDVLTGSSHGKFYMPKELHGLRKKYCTKCKKNMYMEQVCNEHNDTICSPCPFGSHINERYHTKCKCVFDSTSNKSTTTRITFFGNKTTRLTPPVLSDLSNKTITVYSRPSYTGNVIVIIAVIFVVLVVCFVIYKYKEPLLRWFGGENRAGEEESANKGENYPLNDEAGPQQVDGFGEDV